MLLSSQKKNYNKLTTPHVLSQLMGDGWGAGTGARAAERGRGGTGRALAGARWRGGAGGARAREHAGGAGRGVSRSCFLNRAAS